MRADSTDRVMQTVARYLEVQAKDTGSACPLEAARRASARPEFREMVTRVLEGDCQRGSFSCVHFGRADCGADAAMWLPDDTGHGGQVLAVEAKIRDAAACCEAEVHLFLFLLVTAAADVDRSSLGTAGAWSLRRQASADDIAAVRKSLQWPGRIPLPPAPGTGEQPRDPGAPDRAPDPLRASTAAELVTGLARYRHWAGRPSYRDMARRSRPQVSASTLAAVVHADRLPTPRVVSAFVTGCGGGPDEVNEWVTALRRLSGRRGGPPEATADSVAAFGRDLRVLRAKAGLDYPEMAERTHLSMRVLASACGGLRLPPLPVLTVFVKACDGDVASWERRWSALASGKGPAPGPACDCPARERPV